MRTRPSYLYLTLDDPGRGAGPGGLAAQLADRAARPVRAAIAGLGVAFLIVLIVLLAFGTLWAGRLCRSSRSSEGGHGSRRPPT